MNFSKLKSSSAVLMLVIIFSKLIGMGRDVVLAGYFGTSNISDAYNIASTVPTLLFYFIGHSLSTAFLPMYNKIRHEKDDAAAQKFTNNLLLVSLIIATLIVAILILAPELVIKVFAAGFDSDNIALTSKFIRISAVSLYFMTVISIWTGYLQAHKNFIIPASVSVPRNIVVIVSIVLASVIDVSLLAVGLVFAYLSELILLFPFAFKSGYRFSPSLDFKSPELRETLYIVMPIMLGVSISQINKIFDKSIASTVVEGGISALNYASVINNAVQEVLVTGIITILFADCARLVSQGEHGRVKEKLSDTISTLITFLVPATVGVVMFSKEIVVCIFSRGSFDEVSVKMTTGALCCYSFGLCFLALRDTLVKIFYAYKKTRTTTVTSAIAIAISIVLKILLSKYMGVNGLALSTSISAVFHFVVLYILLHRHIGDIGIKKIASVAGKSLISSAAFLAVLTAVFKIFTVNSEFITLLVGVIVGVIIYFIMAIILRIPIAVNITGKIIGFVKKKAK